MPRIPPLPPVTSSFPPEAFDSDGELKPLWQNCAYGVPLNLRCGECMSEASGGIFNPSRIDATLTERGARYGDFPTRAKITQDIKSAMTQGRNWNSLASGQKEALEMVAHKIGRILNGDPDYHDSWHDIIGYTKLVADRLEVKVRESRRSFVDEPVEVGGFDIDRNGPPKFQG